MKKICKKLFSLQQFYTLNEQKLSNLRPLLFIIFPQGFLISKNFGHPTSRSGGKKTFKRYLKNWTDKHTDWRTDKSTYRKHRHRGPMLWKYCLLIQRILVRLWIGLPKQLQRNDKMVTKKSNSIALGGGALYLQLLYFSWKVEAPFSVSPLTILCCIFN